MYHSNGIALEMDNVLDPEKGRGHYWHGQQLLGLNEFFYAKCHDGSWEMEIRAVIPGFECYQ